MPALARKLRLADYFSLAFGTMVGVGWLGFQDLHWAEFSCSPSATSTASGYSAFRTRREKLLTPLKFSRRWSAISPVGCCCWRTLSAARGKRWRWESWLLMSSRG